MGASAAGLFTALRLARAGRKVRLFERTERLTTPARTLIVTDRIRKLLGASVERCAVNQIHAIELFTDSRSAPIQLNTPDLVIERSDLIRTLAEQAQAQGVQLELGRRFVSIQGSRGGIDLTLARVKDGSKEARHERVRCASVVGADGARSSVARAAGWPELETVPLVQALVKLPSGMPSNVARVWFIPEDTPYFYWLIPHSRREGALGLVGTDGRRARQCLERFMQARHFRALGFQGARIPLYNGWVPIQRNLAHGRIYIVGDAAAQVKVTTLGGVVTGFRGAFGLAEKLLSGFSPELRALRRELDWHLLIRRSLHRFRQTDYSRLLDVMNESLRRSLSQVSRDEALSLLWRLSCSQPRLVWMGLRGLFAPAPVPPKEDSSLEVSVWRPSVIQR